MYVFLCTNKRICCGVVFFSFMLAFILKMIVHVLIYNHPNQGINYIQQIEVSGVFFKKSIAIRFRRRNEALHIPTCTIWP